MSKAQFLTLFDLEACCGDKIKRRIVFGASQTLPRLRMASKLSLFKDSSELSFVIKSINRIVFFI